MVFTTDIKSTGHNRRLAQWRVTRLIEHSTSHQLFGVLTVLCSEIRHCAKRQNVVWHNKTEPETVDFNQKKNNEMNRAMTILLTHTF